MATVYSEEYLKEYEVIDNRMFRDRAEFMAEAKRLRKEGWTVKTSRICPFGEDRWFINAERKKE